MKKTILLLTSFLICSCTSQYVYLPNQTFHSPESFGEFGRGSIGVGMSQHTEVTVIKNTQTTPPDETVSFRKCDSGADCSSKIWTLPVQVGLISGLDVTYKNGLFGLQYQFLGDAEKEGLKSAVHLNYGNQKVSIGDSSAINSSTKSTFTDAALSLGYRFTASQMLYLSYSYFTSDSKTEIINGAQIYNYNDKGIHQRAGLGLLLNSQRGYVLLEATGTETTWFRTTEKFNDLSLGGAMGIRW